MDALTALQRSNHAMETVVWPTVGPLWGGGVLTPKLDEFDVTAGIDFLWQKGRTMDGVAARVQWMPADAAPWNSFTIRTRTDFRSRETEARKRADAISLGAMYPTYTLQAFISAEGDLLSAAMCHTSALFEIKDRRIRRELKNGEARFVSVWWDEFGDDQWLKVWIRP